MIITGLLITEIIAFIILAAAVEGENDIGAILLSILIAALAMFTLGINPLTWVPENIINILVAFVGWFAVGAAWSTFKWWRHTNSDEVQEQIRREHKQWKNYHEDSKPAEGREVSWESSSFNTLKLSNNKGKVTRWIVWWPASVVWALTYRLIRWVSRKVYDAMVSVFSSITSSATKRALSSDV